jgi:uncharacterized protein involved in outer membrane biogenesis
MSENIVTPSPLKKPRRWLRWLAWSAVALVVLLVAAYFVVTSSGFLKAVILPRVSGALNAGVTVSDATIHPFSGISLRDLKVQADGQPPLVTVSEVRVSYHLFDLLGGNYHVDEIALVSPTIELVENPDGSSNLGPILKALQAKPAAEKKAASSAKASKPLQIDLGKLTLSHATVRQIKNYADGRRDLAGLTNVNVTLTNLKNGQTAKLELAADIRIENNSTTNSGSLLAASLQGGFSCSFSSDLKPGSASGGVTIAVTQAGGAFSDFNHFNAALDCDVTPTEIRQLALHFQQAGVPLGELTVTGPFDAEKMEGKLDVALRGIDRRLLNLAGAKSGMDFGSTQINCTNEIKLAKAGAAITATGKFNAVKVQLTRGGQTTPTLDLSAAYDVTVDRAGQSATLRSLNFTGTQNGAPLLSAQLASPMSVGLGGGANSLGDAVLDVAVTKLKLADWKPFLGNIANSTGGNGGIDFDTTEINSTNEIQLSKSGAAITATGRFNVDKLQLTRGGQTTPTLDLSAAYDVTVDRAGQSATLRSLNLTGTQNGAPLLSAQLTSPMSLTWGGGTSGMGAAALDLAVTGLNLADWQPFLGNTATAGKVGLKLKVLSHQGGKQIGFDLSTDVANLSARLGSNQISQVEITLDAHGQAAELKQIALSDYKVQITLQNQPALTASGSGNYDLASGDADAQVKLSATLARLFQALPQPGMSITSGDVELNARVTQKQKAQTLTGGLLLTNFNGQIGKNEFLGYSSQLKLDVASSPEQIQIHQVAGSFSQNGNSGGEFDLSGTYQPAQKSAAVNAKFAGVNENALRPFLEPLLTGKKLASVSVNGVVSGQYNPQAGSAVKANVQVANLVVNDPKQQFPATPLAVGLQVDASLNQQTAEVRQFQIALTPTALATNQLQFSGQMDFSKTNAIQGNLKLAADSLDLTRYFDLFAGGTNAAAKTAAANTAPASANAGQEPPAVHLPLRNFTVAADIGKLYLHEVAISNFMTTVKIDDGHFMLKPFQLALNGAPVKATADVDLGVPGYQYNVAFNAQGIPLTPLVDTFQPARAGQMGGALTASAQISGAGVTGASLQKNLSGTFNLGMTNLSLSVINVHSSLLKSVISVVATIPELLSNPTSALTSLFGSVTGHGGLMNQLEQAPIQVISMQAKAGNGLVNLQSATVQSSAFEADATGGVTLDAVLTNSAINIPVTVSLSQAIAKQLNVTSTTASANAAYVALPQFVTMTGTIGNPKANIDKLALTGVVVHSIGGSLLNPAGSNASPVGNLLNQFLRLHK